MSCAGGGACFLVLLPMCLDFPLHVPIRLGHAGMPGFLLGVLDQEHGDDEFEFVHLDGARAVPIEPLEDLTAVL